MSLPFERITFYCCKEDCPEIIVIPAEGGDDARQFLLEETPWTVRRDLDYMHLRCPRHASDGHASDEGDESMSFATEGRHVCKWETEHTSSRGNLMVMETWCKEDATGRFWRQVRKSLLQVKYCPHCGEKASNFAPPEDPGNRREGVREVHVKPTDHPFSLTGLMGGRSFAVESGLVDTDYETVEGLCEGLEKGHINKNSFSGAGAETISNLRELAEKWRRSNDRPPRKL